MINILLWVEDPATMVTVMESTNENGERIYPYPYSVVSEMINGWLLLLEDKDDFDALELALEAYGDIIIVGTYNEDGSQYEWFNKPNNNHTLEKYKDQLNDVIEYDANGDPIGSHRPTDAEALNTQVNKVFGWGNRVLTNEIN